MATYDETQIEAAVIDVLDGVISGAEFIGYEDDELSPLDIASRVLASIKKEN